MWNNNRWNWVGVWGEKVREREREEQINRKMEHWLEMEMEMAWLEKAVGEKGHLSIFSETNQ